MPMLQIQKRIEDSPHWFCSICGEEVLDRKDAVLVKLRGAVKKDVWTHLECLEKAFKYIELEVRR